MRGLLRFSPLFILAFAVGCGGSSSSSGGNGPVLRISGTDDEFSGGIDNAGNPLLVGYTQGGPLRVVTSAGSTSFTVPTLVPGGSPVVTGNFVLLPGSQGGTLGTLILDRRTGATRFNAGETPVAEDGDRVVWEGGTDFVLENLSSAARTTLTLDAEESIEDLAGDRLLVAKNTTPGLSEPIFTYRVRSVDGAASVALGALTGYSRPDAKFVNENGAALGAAFAAGDDVSVPPQRIVRWSATGTASAPLPSMLARPLALAEDGTAIVWDENSGRLYAESGGSLTSLDFRTASGNDAKAASNGRYVFIQDFDLNRIEAFRVR